MATLKSYFIAGLTGSFIISMVVLAIGMMSLNYDTVGYENSSFSEFGNLSLYADLANSTSNDAYGIQKDESLFDVLGGLVIAAISPITNFIDAMGFLQNDVGNMVTSSGAGPGAQLVVTYIISILVLTFAIYFVIKLITKADDQL